MFLVGQNGSGKKTKAKNYALLWKPNRSKKAANKLNVGNLSKCYICKPPVSLKLSENKNNKKENDVINLHLLAHKDIS